MKSARWMGAVLLVTALAAPLAAQRQKQITVLVFAFKDDKGQCQIKTGASSVVAENGSRVTWTLVEPAASASCGKNLRLDLGDKDLRRRRDDDSLDSAGSCNVLGSAENGSGNSSRIHVIKKGGVSGPLRCKYAVHLVQGNNELALEDPDIEIP